MLVHTEPVHPARHGAIGNFRPNSSGGQSGVASHGTVGDVVGRGKRVRNAPAMMNIPLALHWRWLSTEQPFWNDGHRLASLFFAAQERKNEMPVSWARRGPRIRRASRRARRSPAVTTRRAYLAAATLGERGSGQLFQTALRRTGKLGGKPLAAQGWTRHGRAPLQRGGSICAAGVTLHQEGGGRSEDAQELAGHVDSRTAQLYNRKSRKLARAEVERVQL